VTLEEEADPVKLDKAELYIFTPKSSSNGDFLVEACTWELTALWTSGIALNHLDDSSAEIFEIMDKTVRFTL